MTVLSVQPYLFFGGRCKEAMAFYEKAIGAKTVFLMHYHESPEPPAPGTVPPGFENKVMHATVQVGEATILMSDGNEEGARFVGFALSLTLKTEEEVGRAFTALSQDGEVILPPSKTFWSPCFGMLTDRFGVSWMLGLEHKPEA